MDNRTCIVPECAGIPYTHMARNNKKKNARRGQPTSIGAVNTLVTKNRPARIRPMPGGDGRIRVTHSEWVAKISSTGLDFKTMIDLNVNPGLPGTFPWLNALANNYETYCFESLRFRYQPRCSTLTGGTVMMLMDYDCLDGAPTSELRMMNSHRAVNGPIWAPQELICDVADLKKWPQRYTRKGEHVVQDQKTYDVGRFFLCLQDAPLGAAGSLIMDYTVTLMTPQLRDTYLDDSVVILQTDGILPAAPFGTPGQETVAGGLPVTVKSSTKLNVKNPGEYYLNALFNGTNIAAVPDWFTDVGVGEVTMLSKLVDAAGLIARIGVKVKTLLPDVEISTGAFAADTLTNMGIRGSIGAYSI